MPEITEADRDRFQEWHDFDLTLAPISGDDKQRLLEAFAAHREAERERIIGNLTAHVEVLLKKNAAYAAVGLQDYIDEIKQVATTTPPTRSPTTTDNQTKGCDMSAKFTPGPYDIRPYVDGIDIIDSNGSPVAHVADRNFDEQGMPPDNARLIAAAPCLYEALTKARDWFNANCAMAATESRETFAAIDAALAKAAK